MNALMSDASNKTLPQGGSEVVVGPPGVDPLVGREVGGYVIEKALGEGGMGLVYQARHPFLGRRFAVKVLRPELAADQQLSSNFVREAQTLSGLKHPHIIDIVGFGPLDGQRQYMIMEFLEGRTLEAELQEHGALPVHRVLSLAEEILDALEAAHSIDVIHRDLKPSNVFLAKVSGGNTVVKLLDFGLAKLQPQALAGDAGATVAKSTIAGTPDYIAPEQALGKGVSKLSDLYSFGVMLYEVLKGEKLFSARFMSLDPIHDLIDHHLHSEPPKLGESFPEELERLVAELLEKDPSRRPQSVQLVQQRLRRITKDLQREQTRQAPMPVRPVRGEPPAPDEVPEVEVHQFRPSRRGPVLVLVAIFALLAPVLWWATRPPEVVPPPVAEVTPPVALTPVVQPPPAPAPAPAPASETSEPDELSPLSAISPRRPSPRPSPEGRGSVAPSCEPNEKWRTVARAHLQELQQLAASRGSAAAWERFEDAEGPLTSSIAGASSAAECAAVEKKIQQLARELSR